MQKLLFLMLSLVIWSCVEETKPNSPEDKESHAPKPRNKFSDKNIQEIYTLQDERKTVELLPFLDSENPVYRKEAAMTFASVQDSAAIPKLIALLGDQQEIADAAAYALGQIGNEKAAQPMLDAVEKRFSIAVAEAIGKCGNAEQLIAFLELTGDSAKNSSQWQGYAMGIYRFGLRKIVSREAYDFAVSAIQNGPLEAQIYATAYLGRAKKLQPFHDFEQLKGLFENLKAPEPKHHLMRAFGNFEHNACKNWLLNKVIADPKQDYRVTINAIRALPEGLSYPVETYVLIRSAQRGNIHIATAVGEWARDHLLLEEESYFMETSKIPYWRAQDLMMHGCAKSDAPANAPNLNKNPNVENIDWAALRERITNHPKLYDAYSMGLWYLTLGESESNLGAIEDVVFENRRIESTYAMEGLANLYKKFPGKDIPHRLNILKKAMQTADVAIMAQAAIVLREPQFEKELESTEFLSDALKSLKMPQDVETFHEIERTIFQYEGSEDAPLTKVEFNNPIDWELVKRIPVGQICIFKTDSGDVKMQLLVEDAPGSVSNFVKLVESGFYGGAVLHRVVPNFVAQGGCPRGDGWGSSPETIRSEWPLLHYKEGSVGMASAGKDTESCQWFITHSVTPHLDGRYTIFAQVVEGMDVVHRLGMGDRILEVLLPGMPLAQISN